LLVVCGELHDWTSTILALSPSLVLSVNVVGGFSSPIACSRVKSARDERAAAMFVQAVDGRRDRSRGCKLLPWSSLGGILAGRNSPRDTAFIRTLFSPVLFVLGLKGLSSPNIARTGMFAAALGMLLAIVGTLFDPRIAPWGYLFIFVGVAAGSVVGGNDGPAHSDDRRAATNCPVALAGSVGGHAGWRLPSIFAIA